MNNSMKNPYKFDGILHLVRGVVLLAFGTILLFDVKDKVIGDSHNVAGFVFFGGLILLIFGFAATIIGLLRTLRFSVSKDFPKDLVNGHVERIKRENDLLNMLFTGKNPTFYEPAENSTQHVLESLFPKLSETPPYIRKIAVVFFEQIIRSISLYLLFLIMLFTGLSGLTNFMSSPVANYLGWILIFHQLFVWSKTFANSRKLDIPLTYHGVYKILVVPLVIAILLPVALMQIHNMHPIPAIPVSSFPLLIFQAVLLLIMCTCILILLAVRLSKTEKSEASSRSSFDHSATIHPSDVFGQLEREVERYGYIRYFEDKPVLKAEGSMNKGSFSGHVLYETPPEFVMNVFLKWEKICMNSYTVIYHLLFLSVSTWLFISLKTLDTKLGIAKLLYLIIVPLMGWIFSSILSNINYFILGEFDFISNLIYFKISGTYSDYERKIGAAISDSNSDTSKTVKSNMDIKMIVSNIKSTVCTQKGVRYIVTVNRNDDLLSYLYRSVVNFVSGRSIMGNFSLADTQIAADAMRLNQAVRNLKNTGSMTGEDSMQSLPVSIDN